MIYKGGCHCGKVRFEVEAPKKPHLVDCNCSMCEKTGFVHLLVEKHQFTLVSGEQDLTTYAFNTGIAKHRFCKHCGIKSFYIPRSNPNGYSVNARCLDNPPTEFTRQTFDGQNWEQNIQTL